MSDLRTSGLQSSQSLGIIKPQTETPPLQPQEKITPTHEPNPESFKGLKTPPTTVGSQEDLDELRSEIVDAKPSDLNESAKHLLPLTESTSEVPVLKEGPLQDILPLNQPLNQPIIQPNLKPSNQDLLKLSQDSTQPLEKRLQALAQLDNTGDPQLRENAIKLFRNQNKQELTQIQAHFIGQTQHLQVEYNALKGTLAKIPACQPILEKITGLEQELNKTYLALGQGMAKREDVSALTSRIQQLRQQINIAREELMVSLPPDARSGPKFALENLLKVQDQILLLKTQNQRLDLLLRSPGFPESGLEFLCRDPLPTAEVIQQAKDNAFYLELDHFSIKTPGDLSKLVAKIVGHKEWKLDSNAGFENFFHKVLGRESIKSMPHAMRGPLLAELYKAGIGHPDLVVHFVMNNARNLTDKPDRAMLQRPEIKSTHIYQMAKMGVLNESLTRLKATQQGIHLIATLKTQPQLNLDCLGNGLSQLDLNACKNLSEALLDKHTGPNILTTSTQRNAFVKHLKDLGHDTHVLEGGDAQQNLNLLFKALVTSESGDLQDKAPEVFALLQTLKDKSILDQVPPLMRLFVEIQAHPEKEALINALKTPQDLKFDAILSDKLPDMGKVLLLDEALRLHKPELLKDQPALKELYDKLELHPARELLVNALKNIPVNEHEIETRILERSEAVALKAYETVLDAGMNEPEFGRFEDFHNQLKVSASKEGFNEGNNVSQFQDLQNRLSPSFFKKLDDVKSLTDPLLQKEAADRLLQDLKLVKLEDRMEGFFMNYILQDIAEDKANREETNKQYKELLSLDRPLTGADLRNISKLVGANIEYYSQAVAQLNPKAPKTLSQIFAEVGMRGGELGITRMGESKPLPDFQPDPILKQVLGELVGPSSTPGKVSEFFSGIQTPGTQPQNREWAINLSMIRHALAKVPKDDKSTRDQLTLRALSYLTRFASIPNPKDLGVQTTPLQKPLTDYHRANGNPLVKSYRDTLAKHLGVHSENIQVVTDNRVLEVVKRDLRNTGHHQVVDAFDPELKPEDQGKLLKNLVTQAITGDDKSSFFVDISPILAKNFKGGSQDEAFVKDYIQTSRQFVSDVISSTAEEVALDRYKLAHPEDTRPEKDLLTTVRQSPEFAKLKTDLEERVVLGGTLKMGNQSILYTAPLDTDFSSLKPVERKLSPGASTEFKNLVYHSGFTIGPQQMLENWIELSDLDSIMGTLELPKGDVQFPSNQTGKLEKIGDWGQLLNHDTFKTFENLKNEPAPYLQILPNATVSLLKGLQESDLQRTFEAKGLGDLYQISANRILASMEQINANKDNFNKVLDQIQLIHEEIGTLLAIAQPHSIEDFNAMMRKNTDLMPPDFDPSIQPNFFLKNSGMRGLATVFTGVESLKGTGQLNIAVQNDTYYESAFVITGDKEHSTLGNREHSLFSLDGDKVNETAQTMQEKLGGQKLDLYLCEFHHNISYSKTDYHMENLTEQVDKLFAKDMVSDKFTVAIDNTIAQTNGQEFKDFLKHNEQRIKDGKLNIVFYRSAQKFDMLGMDNYNGGIMSVINNGKDFKAFNSKMESSEGREDKLSQINIQGFSHFEKYAQKELNDYRAGIMKAASNLANPDSGSPLAFPKAMYHASSDDMAHPNALLKIAPNTDPSVVFLDLSCPLYEVDSPGANDFLAQLQANLIRRNREKPEDFPLSNRASFGFPHSNISLIGGSKFRFNPGLESEGTLQNFQQHFVKLNELMMEAYNGAPEHLRAGAVKLVLTSTGDQLMKLRDQVKDLEAKAQPVPVDTRLQLIQTYLGCLNYGKVQEQIDALPREGLSQTQTQKLAELKAQLKSEQLIKQISDLEKAVQPVPDKTRLELAEAKSTLKHTGDVRLQLEKIDPTALDEGQLQRFHSLLNSLPVRN